MEKSMILISVYDAVGGTWSNPMVAQNPDAAKRDFAIAVRDERSAIHANPQDYTLYVVGEWTVPFEGMPTLKSVDFRRLCCAADLVEHSHGQA